MRVFCAYTRACEHALFINAPRNTPQHALPAGTWYHHTGVTILANAAWPKGYTRDVRTLSAVAGRTVTIRARRVYGVRGQTTRLYWRGHRGVTRLRAAHARLLRASQRAPGSPHPPPSNDKYLRRCQRSNIIAGGARRGYHVSPLRSAIAPCRNRHHILKRRYYSYVATACGRGRRLATRCGIQRATRGVSSRYLRVLTLLPIQ